MVNFLVEWAWLAAPSTILAIAAVYLIIVALLVRLTAQREAASMAGAMRVYNLAQIALCSYMTYGLFWTLYEAPPLDWEVFGVRLPNIFALNAPFTQETEFFIFLHYFSKLVDFCDTFFIILRKKNEQLTFLHVYHHASIIAIWGILLHWGYGGGAVAFGAWINSLVHVLMYSHYLITSFGINNPFKRQLTSLQIIQFHLCIVQAALVSAGLDAFFPPRIATMQLLYHISMIVLFRNFLQHSDRRSARHTPTTSTSTSTTSTPQLTKKKHAE
eukprot:m.5590 g.5590  ORF g.5590 m.5590 type:complete len:272 (-) comp4564_c0_seq1:24-839(-)